MKKAYPLIQVNNQMHFANAGVAKEYRDDFAGMGVIDGLRKAEIILSHSKRKRSLSANAYYWGVVNKTIADHLDMGQEELHYQILLPVFGPKAVEKDNARNFEFHNEDGSVSGFELRGKGSSKMNSKEFKTFTDLIKEWASLPESPDGTFSTQKGLGLYIPDPDTANDYYDTHAHIIE
jgi:hypothetical protein